MSLLVITADIVTSNIDAGGLSYFLIAMVRSCNGICRATILSFLPRT